jgi:nitronate monooxygenase
MKTKPAFLSKLRLPVIQAPMFLVSGPELVIASCKAGIIGTFPALNPRSEPELDQWLTEIKSKAPQSPFGVNLIVHKTNKRLDGNVQEIVKHKVPIVITSLGAVKDIVQEVQSYGGIVLHDVTNIVHARKAIQAGVDGLIAVCAGAGGHAGLASPFALVPMLRREFDGLVVCAGSISTGGGVRAAKALGADLAYLGTRFIPTVESRAVAGYKQMCVESKLGPAPTYLPTVYTDKISGVPANFLLNSVNKYKGDAEGVEDFSNLDSTLKWKEIWSAGHGVLNIHDIPTVEQLVANLEKEYKAA